MEVAILKYPDLEALDRMAVLARRDLEESHGEVSEDAVYLAACNRRDLADLGVALLRGIQRIHDDRA
jgi:hypothetical protein